MPNQKAPEEKFKEKFLSNTQLKLRKLGVPIIFSKKKK